MSYAANPTRTRAATSRPNAPGPAKRTIGPARDASANKRRPKGRSYEEPTNWGRILLIGATIAAGAALGAGAALLFTEETGPERRAGIARGARRVGHRAERAWDELAFELGEAARSARDRLRRRRHTTTAATDDTEE